MWKLTQHPRQYVYHYDNRVCFAITTIIWESACADAVQVHQDYVGKCTANRLAEVVAIFESFQTMFKEQNINKVLTYSRKYDKKMGHYWTILGFDNRYVLDGVTYSYKEI